MKKYFKINKLSKILKKIKLYLITSFFICAYLFIILLIIESSITTVYALSITQIMFNPKGSDTGREWIEIRLNETDGCINLTEYKLFEEETNHRIYAYNREYTCDYAIIYSDINKFLEDYPYLNDSYFPLFKSTFNLNNNGEIVSIVKGGEVIYQINYTKIVSELNVSEGYSLEYKNYTWNISKFLFGDPGNIIEETLNNMINNTENEVNNNIENSSNNNNNNNTTYNNNTTIETQNNTEIAINITTNITNISGNVNNNDTNMQNTNNNSDIIVDDIIENSQNITLINISINNTNNSNTNISNETKEINNITNTTSPILNNTNITDNNTYSNNNCDASINIIIKNESVIYENEKQIKFYNILNITYINTTMTKKDLNYSIAYWVEDLFNIQIKEIVVTSNQNEKTFTPNIKEEDKILKIKTKLNSINCNILNDSYEKIVLIKNSNYQSITTNCPKCENKKVEYQKTNSNYIESTFKCELSNENNSLKPIIKIINLCNRIDNSSALLKQAESNNSIYEYNTTANAKFSSTTSTLSNAIINPNNLSKSASRATSMIIYESDNIKNRFYAIIGIILLGLTCGIILIKKIYQKHKIEINTKEQSN
jgi:hypothetical protein